MSYPMQRLCAWSGVLAMALWMLGFAVFAGFIPYPSPNDTAEQVTRMYLDNATDIRIGLALTQIGAALMAPFAALTTLQMRRIEGRHATPLAGTQLLLGACLVLEFIFPVMIMLACTFRVDRDPRTIQAMNDVAWIMFVGVVSTETLRMLTVGIAVLRDRRSTPIFPRWLGYLSVLVGLLFCPNYLLVFFKTGPFAWDGVIVFWIPAIVFFGWFVAMSWGLLRAIAGQQAAATAGPAPEDPDHLAATLHAELDRLLAARLSTARPATPE